MSKIIFFNGPPGSGKDTIGNSVAKALFSMYPFMNIRMEKFAAPIKGMAKGIFVWGDEEAEYYMETQEGKAEIVPHTEHLQTYTYRQLLIDFSEKFIKPLFGEDAFGLLLLDRIKGSEADYVIITDCGFKAELQPVINYLGGENCLLVQVHRPDHDFKKDSRSYIKDEQCHNLHLANNKSIAESTQVVLDMLATIDEIDKEREQEYYDQQRRELELLSSTSATSVEN